MTQDVEIFFELHHGLARQAPGGVDVTRRALGYAAPLLPSSPRILDVGSGPGAQSIALAHALPDSSVAAVDNHPPFLAELRESARQQDVGDRIEAAVADMTSLPFRPASFDLIWAEGSIYIIGFEAGLRTWRPLLRRTRILVVTEAVWLTSDVPTECRDFWDAAYPAMMSVDENRATAQRCGFTEVSSFVLPESAWWNYYQPIEARISTIRAKYGDAARAVIDDTWREIDLYRRYSGHYGYACFVFRAEEHPLRPRE